MSLQVSRRAGTLVRIVVRAPDGSRAEADLDLAESPLLWLRSRRDRTGEPLIDDRQFMAGERFRRDYTTAGLVARTTMNWETIGGPAERRAGGNRGANVSDRAIDARRRVARAMEAVGPDLANILVAVCCEFRGLGEFERDHAWPSRSAKVVLRLALNALARHYGLDPGAKGPARGRRRHWGAAGYRPKA